MNNNAPNNTNHKWPIWEFLATALAVASLLFGDNIYERITGRSILPDLVPPTSTVEPTPLPSKAVGVTPLPSEATHPTATLYNCPITANSDEATILYILDVESEAVIKEDFNTLALVYLSNATITESGKIWDDPIQHYRDVFATYTILDVNNSDIRIEFISGEFAVVRRTSSGRVMNESTQEISNYMDDSGEIFFQKDTNGCWRISKFDKAPDGYK